MLSYLGEILACIRLQQRRLKARRLALVEHGGYLVETRTHIIQNGFHLNKMLLNCADVANGLLEADALRAIGTRLIHNSLSLTEGLSNHQAALKLKLLHQVLPTFTRFAKAHIFGENHIVEEAVHKRNNLLTDFLQAAKGITLNVVRDHPQ